MKGKKRLLAIILLNMALTLQSWHVLVAQVDEWPVLNEIKGIGYHLIDSSGTYVFYPYCGDTSFCTDLQLQMYGYVWDFGKHRYSLEPNPRMQFEKNEEVEITLRITGFKTIKDPDERNSPIRPATNNCWVTDTLSGFLKVKAARDILSTPPAQVTILQPSHAPVPGRCSDYLIRIDLPRGCRFSGNLELTGGIQSRAGGGGWNITSFEAADELTVVQRSPGHLTIDIPKGKVSKNHPTHLFLLLHSKFEASATLDDMFRMEVRGNLKALDSKGACKTQAVDVFQESKFTGSLDPPHLACGAPNQVKHGQRILWDLKIQNLGNAPESDIEIIDTLPASLDWDRVEIVSALWNGKDIQVIVENDTANKILKWRLNNDAEPLLPGHYAQVQFYTYVNQDFPCPDAPAGSKLPCQDRSWAGRPIEHWIWTKFHGEQVPDGLMPILHPLSNRETVVLCREACEPDVTPISPQRGPTYTSFWVLAGVAAAIIIGLLIFLFYRDRAKPKE